SDLSDEAHSRNVGQLVELPSVDLREFLRQLTRRPAAPSVDFPMSFRQSDFLACRNCPQNAGSRSDAFGGNASNAGDDVLGQLAGKAEVILSYSNHEIRGVQCDPSPERMRLGILAISDAFGRKLKAAPFRIRNWNGYQLVPALRLLRGFEGPELL